MTQWQDETRGGHPYRITSRDPDLDYPIGGEAYDSDSGLTVRCDWNKDGRISPDGESPYDLIPIELEAPSPARVRVDLALAAMRHKAHSDALQLAEDVLDESKRLVLNTFVASGKTEVVVKIDGDHYYFWVSGQKVYFRKIEVL
jgi:hypothetical protein